MTESTIKNLTYNLLFSIAESNVYDAIVPCPDLDDSESFELFGKDFDDASWVSLPEIQENWKEPLDLGFLNGAHKCLIFLPEWRKIRLLWRPPFPSLGQKVVFDLENSLKPQIKERLDSIDDGESTCISCCTPVKQRLFGDVEDEITGGLMFPSYIQHQRNETLLPSLPHCRVSPFIPRYLSPGVIVPQEAMLVLAKLSSDED